MFRRKSARLITLMLNVSFLLDYNAMAVFMIDISSTKADSKIKFDSSSIVETLIKMKNIIVASKTVGDHDLMAIGVVKDFKHLFYVRNEIAAIPGVKDMEISFWNELTGLCPKILCHLTFLRLKLFYLCYFLI